MVGCANGSGSVASTNSGRAPLLHFEELCVELSAGMGVGVETGVDPGTLDEGLEGTGVSSTKPPPEGFHLEGLALGAGAVELVAKAAC